MDKETIRKAHILAATHIVGVFRATAVADEETVAEVIRILAQGIDFWFAMLIISMT